VEFGAVEGDATLGMKTRTKLRMSSVGEHFG